MRRVVTGHDAAGRPAIVADGPVPRRFEHRHPAGMVQELAWATEAAAPAPRDGADPTAAVASLLPGPGATRLVVVTFPPDSAFADPGFDPAAAAAENAAAAPGLAELFEPESPGMHRSETTDYAFVLEGEVWLDLDEGRETRLAAGDLVVQNATRHAWRNRTQSPAKVAFVLVGAAAEA